MASNHAFAQYALKTCDSHVEKELTAFCKTCCKKICSSSLKEDHITHNWDLIIEFAKKKRRELPGQCERLRTEDIAELRRQVDVYNSLTSELLSESREGENKMNEERSTLIDEINKTYGTKISESRVNTAETIQQFTERKEKLVQKLELLDKLTNALGRESHTIPDHDIIEIEHEMMTELDDAKCYDAEKYSYCNEFVPGEINMETVEGMIGEIHNITVEEISSCKNYTSPVVTVVPNSEGTSWVRESNSATVNLITESGEELKCIDADCMDLTILQDGRIAVTQYTDQEVRIMNDREEVIQKISTAPLHPTRIRKTENNDMLVTLEDGGELFSLLPTSRRIVQRMTLTGQVLHTYEFEEDGKTRLFTLPTKAAENRNTDVCVINRTSRKSSHLIVLHRDGGVKFTYRGHNVSPNNFSPLDLACDTKCRIIISEWRSKSLHLLSPRGQFIGVIRSCNAVPFAISLNGEKLWVGLSHGTVKVYRYASI